MKKFALISLLAGGLLVFGMPNPSDAHVAVSVGFFYNELAPYGHWVNCSYGNCWVPASVGAGWQPYSNGEWIYTDYGWTWVSYDPWGGDPYHYGSWAWVSGYGWAWVPGTVWAPAWVTWCYSDAYIGWAPLPPTFAFTLTGYFGSPYVASARSYVIVPTSSFVGVNASTARVAVSRNTSILSGTQKATGFRVSGGVVRNTALPISRVQKASGKAIPRKSISAAKTDPKAISRAGGRRMTVSSPAKTLRAAYAHGSAAGPPAVKTSKIDRKSQYKQTQQHVKASRSHPTSTARTAPRPVAHPTRTVSTIKRSGPKPAPRTETSVVTRTKPTRTVESHPVHERAMRQPVTARQSVTVRQPAAVWQPVTMRAEHPAHHAAPQATPAPRHAAVSPVVHSRPPQVSGQAKGKERERGR